MLGALEIPESPGPRTASFLKENAMRTSLLIGALLTATIAVCEPALAQVAPPAAAQNSQNNQTSAVANPVGSNTNVQTNINYAGVTSFGPGIQCATPYISGGLFRSDMSQGNFVGNGQANTGGQLQFVIPIGSSSNRTCQALAQEILVQRQLDTCLNVRRAGFKFDPAQFPEQAKRCNALIFDPSVLPNAQPISPPQPPTVITVPAGPSTAQPVPAQQNNVAPQH